MQIIFLKFIAVYSSYRHLFHKKSTTIFIKLEVRWWVGEKGRCTLWNDFSNQHSTLVSQINDLDAALPAGRVFPSFRRAAAGG